MEPINPTDYFWLVERIAKSIIKGLPPSVELEDLIQSGYVGLLDAASRYQPSSGASFKTYAGIRIRGEIIDELRSRTWMTRSMTKNARELRNGGKLEESTKADLALAFVKSLTELGDYLEIVEDTNPNNSPSHICELDQLVAAVREALLAIPSRDRYILVSLFWNEEQNKKIAKDLSLSPGRISQLTNNALAKVKTFILAKNANPNSTAFHTPY